MRYVIGSLAVVVFLVPAWANALDHGEICDDEFSDDNPAVVVDCEVSKTLIDLDAILPNATFFGRFCDSPNVLVGQEDGTFASLLLLSSSTDFVTADITGSTSAATYKFRVVCPCETCESAATIGAGFVGAKR